MENNPVSDKLVEVARSMIERDKNKFSLAALYKQAGISRSALRRVFPDKAALMDAVLSNILTEPKAPPAEPMMTFVDDDLIHRQFRVLERAVELLEVRVETVSGESRHAIAELDQRLSRHLAETPAALSAAPVPVAKLPPIAELPLQKSEPLISRLMADKSVLEAQSEPACPFETIEEASASLYPAPSQNPTRQEMRDMLEKARRVAGDASSVDQPKWGKEQIRVTLVAAGVFAALVVIATVILFENPARATQTPPIPAHQLAAADNYVLLIDASGGSDALPPEKLRGVAEQAEKGDTHAQITLALAYLRGDGVKEDPVLAARWSEAAAERGEPMAEYVLGTLYANGVHPDPIRAFHWYSAAAAQGHVKAMHNLALAYLGGSGVRKDTSAAVMWFTKAAQQGYRDSAFDLAVLFESGQGVTQSRTTALRWYNKAAAAGDIEAAKRATLLRSDLSQVARR